MSQAVSQSHPSEDTTQTKYFDLHTEGFGYLGRIRDVPVKNGKPYLCCMIAALRGSSSNPEYTYFDLRVSGTTAKEIVQMLREAVEFDQKVLIGFRAGDTYPELFTYEHGPKQGQIGVSTKGRLLKVKWAKIDGMPIDLPGDEQEAPVEGEDEALPEPEPVKPKIEQKPPKAVEWASELEAKAKAARSGGRAMAARR